MLLSHKFAPFFELLSDDLALVEKHKDIRYVVLTGGRASGKSFVGSVWCSQATFKGWGILFTRYTMSAAYDSIIPEFREKTEMLGKEDAYTFLQNSVVNNITGAKISYRGLKPSSKTANSALKSVANKNVFILEEGEECADKDLFDKVNLSIRDKKKKNLVIIMLNPTHVDHWIYKTFVKEERKDTMLIHTTYLDNYENLNKSFIEEANWVKGNNLKRYMHQFMGEWHSDTDGALFRMADINRNRINIDQYREKDIREIIISWDPGGKDKKKENKEGRQPDADGIVVMSRCADNFHYLLHDKSLLSTRSKVAEAVVNAYDISEAHCLVIEQNQGCDWLKQAIYNIDRTVRIKMVAAVVSKSKRATATIALMERDKIRHVGVFAELEYEMVTWIEGVSPNSPNRMDAYVHANNKLIKKKEFKAYF